MTSTTDLKNKVVAREDNPKAVFYGSHENIIEPLALYLNSQSVDLFSAKVLSDAFFGTYFFYTGDVDTVKAFLEQHGKELPKSLFFLSSRSEVDIVEKVIKPFAHLKIVLVAHEKTLTEKDVRDIFEFFFASSSVIFEIQSKPLLDEVNQVPVADVETLPEDRVDNDQQSRSVSEELPYLKTSTSAVSDSARTPVISLESKSGDDGVKGLYKTQLNQNHSSSSRRRKISKLFVGSLVTIFVFLIFPILLVIGEFGLGVLALSRAEDYFNKGNMGSSKQALEGAGLFFSLAKNHLNTAEPVFTLLTLREAHSQWVQMSEVGLQLSRGTENLLEAYQDGKLLVKGVLQKDETVSFGQLVSSIKGNLTLADSNLAYVEAQLKTSTLRKILTSRWFLRSGKIEERVGDIRSKIEVSRNAMSVLPEMTGFYGKRLFVVILQNNMELRPTGGFIGSYALVEFEDGHLQNVKIEDVYTADGALEGHVAPPLAISTHLGQEHWYLRDSNWDPDFSRSGARVAWFIDKELDVQADGVIAVDLELIRSILDAIGPIEIADFQVTATADNLFSLAHEQIESNFFPGSTHKKDFLSSLGNKLLEKLTLEKEIPHTQIASKLYDGIHQKHLMVYSVNPTLQKTLEAFGWAGVHDLPQNCTADNCVQDYQMVVDANLGSNKANYYVERKIHDTVTFENDKLIHNLEIVYKNTSPEKTQVGGNYKNYVRVYVSEGAELSGVLIDNVPLAITQDSVASVSGVIATRQEKMEVFEALVDVEPQKQKTLSFLYETPLSTSNHPKIEYVYHVQKQPGTKNDTYELTVKYPHGWGVAGDVKTNSNVAGAATLVNEGSIAYNTSLWQDQVIRLSVTK